MADVSPCLDGQQKVTVHRPNGSQAHQVALDELVESPNYFHFYAYDHLDYATATGAWVITQIQDGAQTATLTNPVSFTIKRASTVTLSVPAVNVPAKPRATGTVKYWTSTGVQAPAPGRRVNIRAWQAPGSGSIVASTTTDSNGNYAVTVPVGSGITTQAEVPSTSTLGWVVGYKNNVRTMVLHPTSITGTAAPTSTTVIKAGTKMSTHGHLTVVTTAGKTVPYASQTVVVQARPKSNPRFGYSTVATATTTNTGYYYTNWNASVDADVRVAFLSPYQTITSSYRWVRAIDVQ